MNTNGSRPELLSGRSLKVRCLDLHGVMEYDDDDIPILYRARCVNRRCCPRREGFASYHTWRLTGPDAGAFTTEYIRFRSAGELPAVTEIAATR